MHISELDICKTVVWVIDVPLYQMKDAKLLTKLKYYPLPGQCLTVYTVFVVVEVDSLAEFELLLSKSYIVNQTAQCG